MALAVDQIAAIAAASIQAARLTPSKQSFWIIHLLTKLLDLLEDMNTRLLNLDTMKRCANRYFGNNATADNVPASNAMNIADIIPNTDIDQKKLFFNRKDQCTWTKFDGTEAEVKVIEGTKSTGYGNDPLKMLDEMELKFNQIKDISAITVFTTKQFTIQDFQALLITTNQGFQQYIKSKK
eukprot:4826281-Ditylum_brightwellii.AAC.1